MQRFALAALALVLLLGAATAAAAPGKGRATGKAGTATAGADKGKGGDRSDRGTTGKPLGPIAAGYDEVGSGNGLEAGGETALSEDVTVNIVYVGIDPDTSAVGAELSASGSPTVASRLWYPNPTPEPLGITYHYTYNHVSTDAAWEGAFFDWLAGKAVLQSSVDGLTRSLFQDEYNAQASNKLDVGTNYFITAPDVEKYLIDNAPAGVDTSQPTIFYIDWYRGDPDTFKFHTYVKMGEPDPDTGYDFGLNRQSRKIVAWGGTTPDDEETGLGDARGVNRVWFYDLSAGPETWGGSSLVDDADIDGDGGADYRVPVSWEYTGSPLSYAHPGFSTATLSKDLGLVTRYVAVNLLFTTSPIYPPYFRANRLPETVQLDVNTVEGWNQLNASEDLIDADLFLAEEKELPAGWETTLTADYQDVSFSGDWSRCFQQFVNDNVCYNDLAAYAGAGGFVNPFLVTARHLGDLLDGDADYEAALINFATGMKPKDPGLLGFADDNWIDGTQSGVNSFVYPSARDAGYGLTTTMIHEYGHHSSMAHPHDGYDPGTSTPYEPTGKTFFAWLGDESNSMMSYIDLNWDFSQFDRDNSARQHAAGYAMIANRVAADLVGEPAAAPGLTAADTDLADAQAAFAAHDYMTALAEARSAYWNVRDAADAADIEVRVVEPSAFTILGPTKPGNGPGKAKKSAFARDLDARANAKRMFSK